MTLQEAIEILEQMRRSSHTQRRNDVIGEAVQYARLRVDWLRTPRAEREDVDRRRRIVHDALVDTCRILARNMAGSGEPVDWWQTLGDDRRRIGDFACLLHCILGLEAR